MESLKYATLWIASSLTLFVPRNDKAESLLSLQDSTFAFNRSGFNKGG